MWECPVLSGVSVGPCVGVLPSDSWGWERGDREKTSQSGSDSGMDLPCSRAESEAAPWAQGQAIGAGNTRDLHCSSSSFGSQAALAHLQTGWAGGQGRDGRACVPMGPGPQSQLVVLILHTSLSNSQWPRFQRRTDQGSNPALSR